MLQDHSINIGDAYLKEDEYNIVQYLGMFELKSTYN